jgi:hypothetical protein
VEDDPLTLVSSPLCVSCFIWKLFRSVVWRIFDWT